MALETQTVAIDFTQGMETRTHPKLRLPGQWTRLFNCTLSKDGTPRKRDGVGALVGTANGHGLATFDDSLLTVRGHELKSVSTSPTSAANTVSGQLGYLHLTHEAVERTTTKRDSIDCAYGMGLLAYVWREFDSYGAPQALRMRAVDAVTGAIVFDSPYNTANASIPRVVYAGGAFYFFWLLGGGSLWCRIWSPTLGLGAATILVAVLVGQRCMDACAFGDDSGVATAAVSYTYQDGVTSVRCAKVTRVGLVPAIATSANLFTEAQLPTLDVCGIAVATMGGTSGIGAYCGTFTFAPTAVAMGGLAGINVDAGWLQSLATQLDATIYYGSITFTHVVAVSYPVAGTTETAVYFDDYSDLGGALSGTVAPALRAVFVQAAAFAMPLTVLGAKTLIRSCIYSGGIYPTSPQGPFIAGKPMVVGPVSGGFDVPGVVVLPCVMFAGLQTPPNAQSGYFLLDGSTGAVVGKALYGYALRRENLTASTPPTAPLIGVGQRPTVNTFALPVLESGRISFTDGTDSTPTGVSLLRVRPNSPVTSSDASDGEPFAPSNGQLGRSLVLGNGMLSMFDGQATVEANWNMYPEGIVVTRAGGGGTWPAGTYQFVAIYEWVDGQGQRHQSAPSQPYSLAVTLNDTLTFRTPSLVLTQRANVRHVLFGTEANGTIFHRLPAVVANVPSVPYTTTAVTTPVDPSNELLYTQPEQAGTTLPNVAHGPASVVGVHQSRLWADLPDQPGAIRYSQQWVEGVGLQWSEAFELRVPEDAGDVTGLRSMDDALIILCERGLYRVTGSGPTPSGANNGYSDPVEIPSDVGASNPRAIVSMPDGILFHSFKGWYRLGRDLSVAYVGGPVKEYDGDTFTSACLVEDKQELRISSRRSLVDPGAVAVRAAQLVYSYTSGAWSVQLVSAVDFLSSDTYLVSDGVWWPAIGRHVTIGLRSGLNQDTPGTYADSPGASGFSVQVGMSATSSFVHLGVLEGYQRVRWLYLTMSAGSSSSNVRLGIDFDDLYASVNPPGAPGSYSTSPTPVAGIGVNLATVDIRHKFRRQKCKSFAVTITETPDIIAGPTGWFGVQAMAIEVGVKRGPKRLPAAQGVG